MELPQKISGEKIAFAAQQLYTNISRKNIPGLILLEQSCTIMQILLMIDGIA